MFFNLRIDQVNNVVGRHIKFDFKKVDLRRDMYFAFVLN